jgi:hypothetical protein
LVVRKLFQTRFQPAGQRAKSRNRWAIESLCRLLSRILNDAASQPYAASLTAQAVHDGLKNPQRLLALMTLGMATAMAVLDGAIVNVALPIMARDLAVSPATSVWIVNAFQLAVAISLLPLSALGDTLGYRRVYWPAPPQRDQFEFRLRPRIATLEPTMMRPYSAAGLEHRSRCGVCVDEPQVAVGDQNRLSDLAQHEICRSELICGPFPVQADTQGPAEMAGEAAKPHEIVRIEIAERRVAEGDEDRRGAFLEQRRERRDTVKILWPEPIGEKLGPNQVALRHHHLVSQGLAPSPDLLPNSVARSEPPIGRGRVQGRIDAECAEAAELVGLLSCAPRPTPTALIAFATRVSARFHSVIICAVVDEADELVVLADHLGLPPQIWDFVFPRMLRRQFADIPRPGDFSAIADTRGYKPSYLRSLPKAKAAALELAC